MKSFIEEYGFAVLRTVIVFSLIGIVIYLSPTLKEKVLTMIGVAKDETVSSVQKDSDRQTPYLSQVSENGEFEVKYGTASQSDPINVEYRIQNVDGKWSDNWIRLVGLLSTNDSVHKGSFSATIRNRESIQIRVIDETLDSKKYSLSNVIVYNGEDSLGNNRVISKTIEDIKNCKTIGGKIYYDAGDNGATYKFFDTDYNEITYTSISSLSNAVYYSVTGMGTKDRFYVVASDSSKSDFNSTYGVNVGDSLYWGYYDIKIGTLADIIGSGKSNTQTILTNSDTSEFNEKHGKAHKSIWEWLNVVNTNSYGGYSDWFIGSKAELDALNASNITASLFDTNHLWSTIEYNNLRAYIWDYDRDVWNNREKNSYRNSVALRTLDSKGN